MEAELMPVDVAEQNVHAVIRRFKATCPTCGPFPCDHVGHHGTITKKQMAQRFPKRARKRLANALPEDERKLFKRTVAGKREPKDGEVERWLAMQEDIRKNGRG
jgi:hypothetical protein